MKILTLILSIYTIVASAQEATVFVNMDTNTCKNIEISGVIDKKYYNKHTLFEKSIKTKSNQYKFVLQIDKKFPLPYALVCNVSENDFVQTFPFLLNSNLTSFNIVGNLKTTEQPLPLKTKKNLIINDQYRFNKYFLDNYALFFDFTNSDKNEKLDNLLINYSIKNHNSYMLFWTLVYQFQFKGYREAYRISFNNLSNEIKNSEYGKLFNEDLFNAQFFSNGKKFIDLKFNKNSISKSFGSKFTLIDFWFSNCKPCLEEIPNHKLIYSKYKNKGFEIISISTDRTRDIENWKKVIKEKELFWQQNLDENGIEAKKYNINKFPTNFLLDYEGKIIKKDISSEELEKFLEENLK